MRSKQTVSVHQRWVAMATASSPPALPLVVTMPEHLNDIARDRIQKFMAQASPLLSGSPLYAAMAQSEPEIFAQKWLLARMWVVADAVAMLAGAIAYRSSRRLDTTPHFPSAFPIRGYDQSALAAFQGIGERKEGVLDAQCKNISRCLCQVWHKWDKGGRPISIEKTGLIQSRKLVETCKKLTLPGSEWTDPFLAAHIHSSEVGRALVRYKNAHRTGASVVHQVTVILDCAGLGMSTLYQHAMRCLKAAAENDQKFYPESLHKLYVVNCPKIVSYAWNIVKPWLDERTQNKIFFYKDHETKAKLLEDIDADCLPVELGGTCSCAGSCIPSSLDEVTEVEGMTEKIVVGRGSVEKRFADVAAGAMLVWELSCDDDCEVRFRVQSESSGAADIFPSQLVSETTGNFVAPTSMRVTVTFDNSDAWIKSKTLRFRMSVHSEEEKLHQGVYD